jgi:hypothetical protein
LKKGGGEGLGARREKGVERLKSKIFRGGEGSGGGRVEGEGCMWNMRDSKGRRSSYVEYKESEEE